MEFFAVWTDIYIAFCVIIKSGALNRCFRNIVIRRGPHKEGDAHIIQYTVRQEKIICSVSSGGLNWNDGVVDTLYLVKVRYRIADISRGHGYIQNDPMVGIQCFMR